ncbi:gliding motility-associated C-terminal domain-containing protein [Seonamhaeicola sp. MEBiC1930]|uniref:Ig-like domain-containing protein n=1 Tax=Seonamhaeicola sp. MEBiC01930 TaxID=2976768 RepID=UPI003250074C
MITKSAFRNAIRKATYALVLLCTSYSSFAQCPTIPDSTPPAICDASDFTFADLDAYATDQGNGIVWYDSSLGGHSFSSNELVIEGTYYVDDNSGTCGSRNSITIDFQVNSVPLGASIDKFYCSSENADIQDYIDDTLTPYITTGVEIYYDLELTNQANATDTLSNGIITYYIIFIDGGCRSQINIGTSIVAVSPSDPTPAGIQEFCSDSTPLVGNLDPGTTDTFNWYLNINGEGDPIPPALSLTTSLMDGTTYYVQADNLICDSNPVAVTVSINNAFDSGTSGALELCHNTIPSSDFNLFDELGGSPDTNGTWSGPLATINGYLGTVNISTLTTPNIYTFTYTVPANGTCPKSSSNVFITIHEALNSGTVSTINPATFCEQNLPASFDLFTLLDNEDAGGQWTIGTTSSDPVISSQIDLSTGSFTLGTYNFTYTQNILPNPCNEESTTVQVVVLSDPNAGNAVNQTFCENELGTNSPFNLFNALDGSQDNNSGTWTDAANVTISNTIDITGFTLSGSPYLFTYTISNGACEDSETISITIEDAPESGIPVSAFPEFCEGSAPSSYDLFSLLENEDQTGTWYIGTDNTGASTTNTINLSGLTPNTYSYTYDVDAIGSCDDELVTVQITINPLPNTGIPSSATFCENDVIPNSPLDLFAQLSGEDSGGTWTDDDVSGALTGSDVDLTVLTIGSFNYTYTITDANSCTSSSTVTITIEDAPESGIANSAFEVCLSDVGLVYIIDLFSLIEGEDQTGVWNDDDATGGVSGGTVNISGLLAGTYNFTYDVTAIGSCDDVNVTVSIVINDTPAPVAVSPQEFCDTAMVSDLAATGNNVQWYDVITGGTPLSSSTTLINGQTYYATQTDASTGCESSMRTAVDVTIYQTPNAGNPNTTPIVACNNDSNIDLFTGFDGTQDTGGTWNNDDGVGVLSGNIFDATGVASGTYSFTYLVTASAPCVDDNETITVTIEEPLDAGTDAAPLDLCSNNGTVDLFAQLGGTPDSGGIWSPALASGTGVFDPLVDISGTYTYTLSNSCGTVSSSIDVSVTLAPNAGSDNALTLCLIDDALDLFTLLGTSAQTGGTWSPALASGTGVFDPLIDTAGVYTYTVAAVAPCSPDSTSDITITVDDTPTPIVINNNPEFCLINNPTVSDLNSEISSSGTINWYEDAALTLPLTGTETLVDGEDYYATQTNSTGCESSTSVQIDVVVYETPTPTLINVSEEYCINDGPTINELTSNISYNASSYDLVWYDADVGGSRISGNASLTNTTYYAALVDLVTGCESSIRLEVTPDVTACGKISMPDGFSPNGDGVNDTYDIDNLGLLYPNFEIEIYNRNGNIVYRGNANTPRFDGTSNQSRIVAKGDLPVGVYFYIFRFNDGENKPEQGRLYLSR